MDSKKLKEIKWGRGVILNHSPFLGLFDLHFLKMSRVFLHGTVNSKQFFLWKSDAKLSNFLIPFFTFKK